MDATDRKATLAPLQVPLAAAARFFPEDVPPEREDEEAVALAVLDFDHAPEAAALFGSLLDCGPSFWCRAIAEVWVPLAADDEPYLEEHAQHPVLRYLVGRGFEGDQMVQALSFLVCAQCEPGLQWLVTHSDQMGIGSTLPDDVDPEDPSIIPFILPVEIDPVEVAYVELAAWRRSHVSWPH